MTHPPTDEQTAILDAARTSGDNLILNALAGCGKTATIRLVERGIRTKPILYLVFNTRNSKESEFKAKAKPDEAAGRMLSTTTVRTFNSMGHRIWNAKLGRNCAPDKNKCGDILREVIKSSPRGVQSVMWSIYWEVLSGVALAKALGYIPDGKFTNAKRLCTQADLHSALDEEPDELVSDLIDKVLEISIKTAFDGFIDFNDQIYMPALFGGTFPQFPLVCVDEAQDQNPCNHELLRRLVKNRLIVVGDPWQNIYGFRGAKPGGMAELQTKYSMRPLDLSTSFRCPSAVVEAARWRVPHFKWFREGGHVETLTQLEANHIPDDATFLCRNNAPLFRLAMQLLAGGRSVSVAGSDIGPKLIAIMRKLGSDDLARGRVLEAIAEWQADREAKESKTAGDLADCMRVFAKQGNTLSTAIAYAEHLFKQEGTIRLSTGHKAKGLEFQTVYHLDPWLIRSDEQDQNLRYVIQTRSADRYFEVDSANIRWAQ